MRDEINKKISDDDLSNGVQFMQLYRRMRAEWRGEEEFNAANADNVSKFECMFIHIMYKTFLKQ